MKTYNKKKPMTSEKFFDTVCDILREKGMMPKILWYDLAEKPGKPMTTYSFELTNRLWYGGSEGIYLDISCQPFDLRGNRMEPFMLGCFKTLDTKPEAMRAMALLLADFIVEASQYVRDNMDDFTWEGFTVFPYNEDGERAEYIITYVSKEAAEEDLGKLLLKHPVIIMRDNVTRKEKRYEAPKPE